MFTFHEIINKIAIDKVGTSAVNAVAFDHSGVYLGIAGGGDNGRQVQVKVVKEWVASAVSFLRWVWVSINGLFCLMIVTLKRSF